MATAASLVRHGLVCLLALLATPLVALGVAAAVLCHFAEEFLRSYESRKYRR